MDDETYKIFLIRFDVSEDCFIAYEEGEEIHRDMSLKNLKSWLDDYSKKGFKRIEIYKINSANEITIATITSFNSQQKEIWVISQNKTRSKECLRWSQDLYIKSDKNKKILDELVKLYREQERLEKKIEDTKNSLEEMTYKEMCRITGEKEID